MRRCAVVLILFSLLTGLLGGCSGGGGGDTELVDATPPTTAVAPTTTSTTEAPSTTDLPILPGGSDPAEAEGLEFRPVLAVLPPPCDRGQFEEQAGSTCYLLGEVAVDETAIESAQAVLPSETEDWIVTPEFLPGEDGIDRFNAVAAECFAAAPSCPTRQLAIVLDGTVLSAPSILEQPTFERDEIRISGEFTEQQAKDLAEALVA